MDLVPRHSWTSPPSIQTVDGVRLTANTAADAYFRWVDAAFPGVQVSREGGEVGLHLFGSRSPAIALRQTAGDRAISDFTVVGGFLTAAPASGTFRFAREQDSLQISLRGYTPRLPRPVYWLSHALVHRLTMALFCRHLRRLHPEEGS